MKRFSSLKFRDFIPEFSSYRRIVWNGVEIFNDEDAAPQDIMVIDEKFGDKFVYTMFVRVVDIHHCELFIEGEEVELDE